MEVKIEHPYTLEEIRTLYACLVACGLLSRQDVDHAEAYIQRFKPDFLAMDFFSINNLLLPFLDRFVGFSKEERDLFRVMHDSDSFYRNLSLRLLQGSPLERYFPGCAIEPESGDLLLHAGHRQKRVPFRTHTEYLAGVTTAINELLRDDAADAAFHELGFDEHTAFVLLTHRQYQCLLEHRAVHFAQVEYPEIEAWRKTVRDENLPF